MIVTLNVASKFTTIKLSKTMESYLKFSFNTYLCYFLGRVEGYLHSGCINSYVYNSFDFFV
jgi:hypothetical protein